MPVQLAALPCSQTKYPQGETHNATETEGKRHSLAGGGGTGGDIASDSPELQAIIDAWPSLSDDVKASILAMVLATERE